MGNSNVNIYFLSSNLIQCCNILNFQKSNEFDFKGSNAIQLSGQFRKRNNKLINNNNKPIQNIKMKIIEKNIQLEIESQNKSYKKTITITPWGIEGSSKIINYEEGCPIYFGYDSNIRQVSQNALFINK